MTKIIIIYFGILLLITSTGMAQENYKRTGGLTTSFQQSDVGIQIPIWLGSKATLAPFFSFISVSNSGNDISVGLISKNYLEMKKLAPYIGIKFGVALYSPEKAGNKRTTDVIGGLAFGGDYFFDPRFCIGVEGQINVSHSDENSVRFGNPGGTNLNTSMALNASIFFGK